MCVCILYIGLCLIILNHDSIANYTCIGREHKKQRAVYALGLSVTIGQRTGKLKNRVADLHVDVDDAAVWRFLKRSVWRLIPQYPLNRSSNLPIVD